jgi:hypothetical protein
VFLQTEPIDRTNALREISKNRIASGWLTNDPLGSLRYVLSPKLAVCDYDHYADDDRHDDEDGDDDHDADQDEAGYDD